LQKNVFKENHGDISLSSEKNPVKKKPVEPVEVKKKKGKNS